MLYRATVGISVIPGRCILKTAGREMSSVKAAATIYNADGFLNDVIIVTLLSANDECISSPNTAE